MLKKSTAPGWRFLFTHPAHFIACGCGSGLSPWAPGTIGTLFAWATFPLLQLAMQGTTLLAFIGLAFVVGVAAAQRTGADLGVVDHGSIVWDEIVPFWAVLFFCPAGLLWQAAAFFLFRFFDIVKPQPARYFDEHVKNGFGVMTDDAFAAAYTLAVLLGAQALLGHGQFGLL